ncbi:MAG TPA: hypothetical protein VGB42_08115 [Candidatus Thermoplasmatota archaeon]
MAAIAADVVAVARREADSGYLKRDMLKVRQAAEKTWLAVNLATDDAMARHGRTPEPGPAAHTSRHEFLEAIGRRDISKELSFFADRLHGDCFYRGACPAEDGMRLALDEAEAYIRRLRAEV